MIKILYALIKKSGLSRLSRSCIGICLVFAFPLYTGAKNSLPPTGPLRQIWYSKNKEVTNTDRLNAGIDLSYIYAQSNLDSLRCISQEIIQYGKQLQDKKWLSKGWLMLARYHYSIGQLDSAIADYHRTLKFVIPGFHPSKPSIYGRLGLVYANLNQLDSAIYYFKNASSFFNGVKDSISIGHTYNNLGTTYQIQGKYIEALDSYLQSKKLGTTRVKYTALMNIGSIFNTLGLQQEAKASHAEALQIAQRINRPNIIIKSYATSLEASANLQEAQGIIDRGLRLIDSFPLPKPTLVFLLAVGDVYMKYQKIDQAKRYYDQALTMATNLQDKIACMNASLALAQIASLKGNYAQSQQLCQQIQAPLEKNNSTDNLIILYGTLSKNYEALQQPAQALFYLRKKEAQEAIFNNEENIKAALSTYIQRKSERERAALKLAKTNAEKLAVAVQAKAQLNYGIFGLLSLFLAGTVAVYYTFYRQKKSAAEQLTQVNQLLEGEKQKLTLSNTKLQRFSGIVSHDILSNLDLILSTGNVLVGSRPNAENLNKYYTLTQNTGRQLKEYCLGLLAEAKASQGPALAEIGDPTAVLNKVLERFGPALQEKGFAVEVGELPSSRLPLSVVEQVLQNLVSNALRYASQVPNPRLRIGSGIDAQGNLCWYVADNGPGQAAEINRMIQGEQTNSAKGQGIGLSLLQATLRDYGWSLQAEAVDGGGVRLVVGSRG